MTSALEESPLTQFIQTLWKGRANGMEDVNVGVCVPHTVIYEHNFPKGLFHTTLHGSLQRRSGKDIDSKSVVEVFGQGAARTRGDFARGKAKAPGGGNMGRRANGTHQSGSGGNGGGGGSSGSGGGVSPEDVVAVYIERHADAAGRYAVQFLTDEGLRAFLLGAPPRLAGAGGGGGSGGGGRGGGTGVAGGALGDTAADGDPPPSTADVRLVPNKNGLLQQFVYPIGCHKETIQVLWTAHACIAEKVRNRCSLFDYAKTPFQRAATFEGPARFCEKAYVAPRVATAIRQQCESLVEQVYVVEHRLVEEMTLYFTVDETAVLWLSWCPHIRLAPPGSGTGGGSLGLAPTLRSLLSSPPGQAVGSGGGAATGGNTGGGGGGGNNGGSSDAGGGSGGGRILPDFHIPPAYRGTAALRGRSTAAARGGRPACTPNAAIAVLVPVPDTGSGGNNAAGGHSTAGGGAGGAVGGGTRAVRQLLHRITQNSTFVAVSEAVLLGDVVPPRRKAVAAALSGSAGNAPVAFAGSPPAASAGASFPAGADGRRPSTRSAGSLGLAPRSPRSPSLGSERLAPLPRSGAAAVAGGGRGASVATPAPGASRLSHSRDTQGTSGGARSNANPSAGGTIGGSNAPTSANSTFVDDASLVATGCDFRFPSMEMRCMDARPANAGFVLPTRSRLMPRLAWLQGRPLTVERRPRSTTPVSAADSFFGFHAASLAASAPRRGGGVGTRLSADPPPNVTVVAAPPATAGGGRGVGDGAVSPSPSPRLLLTPLAGPAGPANSSGAGAAAGGGGAPTAHAFASASAGGGGPLPPYRRVVYKVDTPSDAEASDAAMAPTPLHFSPGLEDDGGHGPRRRVAATPGDEARALANAPPDAHLVPSPEEEAAEIAAGGDGNGVWAHARAMARVKDSVVLAVDFMESLRAAAYAHFLLWDTDRPLPFSVPTFLFASDDIAAHVVAFLARTLPSLAGGVAEAVALDRQVMRCGVIDDLSHHHDCCEALQSRAQQQQQQQQQQGRDDVPVASGGGAGARHSELSSDDLALPCFLVPSQAAANILASRMAPFFLCALRNAHAEAEWSLVQARAAARHTAAAAAASAVAAAAASEAALLSAAGGGGGGASVRPPMRSPSGARLTAS